MAVEEESMVSHYVCCLSYNGLWRVSIPDFDKLKPHDKPELKMGCVFTDPVMLPRNMGILSFDHKVCMVGGKDYHPVLQFGFKPSYKLFVLDPKCFEEFPVKNPDFLHKPIIVPTDMMKRLEYPKVIQVKHRFFFLTEYRCPWRGISFQLFDPSRIKNPFFILDPPPYRPKDSIFRVVAHFAACDYIYIFLEENYDPNKRVAFYFSITSRKWMKIQSMVAKFTEKNIPLPLFHSGDTGVSQELLGDPLILVAFSTNKLTAYRVTISENGHLNPISSRSLDEINLTVENDCTAGPHLLDIGRGRFCTVQQSCETSAFQVCVFKIDFAQEHDIQASDGVLPGRKSSEILCSRIFLDDIPSFYAYCLASAPASQRSANRIAAAEEQDRDGHGNSSKEEDQGRGGERTMLNQRTR